MTLSNSNPLAVYAGIIINSLLNFFDDASTIEISNSSFNKLYIFSASTLSFVIIAVDLYSLCSLLTSSISDNFKSFIPYLFINLF